MLLRAMTSDAESTRRQLEKLHASEQMQKADASRKLLAYLAEVESTQGRQPASS